MTDKIGEYELNKIYCMDCLEGLKKIPDNSINLIVTSPPYNQSLTTQDKNMLLYFDEKEDDDYKDWIREIFKEFNRILKHDGSIFYNYKTDVKNNILKRASQHIDYVKGDLLISAEIIWKYAGNFDSADCRFPTDYEMIYQLTKSNKYYFKYAGNGLSSVWYINHVMFGTTEKKSCMNHPCPYPLSLIRKILKHTSDINYIVLDPFMGSGTTAVACKQLGRKFLGFEIDKNYVDIANKRLAQQILTFSEQTKNDTSDLEKGKAALNKLMSEILR